MPLLAPIISWLFTALVTIFLKFFTIQKAFRLAFAVVLIGLVTALFFSAKSCVTGVCGAAIASMSANHHYFAVGLGMAFNSTTGTAVSCYIGVWVSCQLYVVKKRFIELTTAP